MLATPTVAETFPSQPADELFRELETAFQLERESGAIFHQAAEKFQKNSGLDASLGDVKKALRRFHKAYSESNGPAERGIIYRGLLGSLRKDNLEGGWNIILWEKLRELQPADVGFLDRLSNAKGSLQVADDSEDYELAERLSRLGLTFVTVSPGTGDVWVSPRGMSAKLLSFIF